MRCDASIAVGIFVNIPEELSKILTKVSLVEEISTSYYVKKGLENLEDYEEANKAYDEFVFSGGKRFFLQWWKKNLICKLFIKIEFEKKPKSSFIS